jgi:hypothetical protein
MNTPPNLLLVGTTALELSALREHLDSCKGTRGHLFSMRCAVQGVNGFVAARFVTTLMVLALLAGIVSLAA